jgi:hypothetical protein
MRTESASFRVRSSLRVGIVIASWVLPVMAIAQGGIEEVTINGPGGLCLDIPGSYSATHLPPDGTPLVLSSCDGSDDQRFGRGYGDYEGSLIGLGGMVISGRGNAVVLLTARGSEPRLRDGAIHVPTPGADRCVTSTMPPRPGAPLRLEPCDGRPGQAFSVAP